MKASIDLSKTTGVRPWCKSFALKASLFIIIVSSVTLLGLYFPVPVLSDILQTSGKIKANTLFAFMLAGVSLFFLTKEPGTPQARLIAQACASLVLLIGMATLLEYITGRDLGIDQLLLKDTGRLAATHAPGRMPPNTALTFFLTGLALLFSHGFYRIRFAQFLTLIVSLAGLFNSMAYVYGAETLHNGLRHMQMPIHSAALFLILSTGMIFARPECGLMESFTSDAMSGVLARSLIPLGILVPFLFGWMNLAGQQADFYGTAFGLTLVVFSNSIFFVSAFGLAVGFFRRAELARKSIEQRLKLIIEATPNGMIMVGREGKITLVNSQIKKLFGYSGRELIGQKIEILVPERYRANHPGHRHGFAANPKVRPMGAGREIFGQRKDGTEVPIEISLNPITTPEGLFTLASIVDVTIRKKMEQEIFNRNRELEMLLHVTSHDLKEPLRAIENFSGMIAEEHAQNLEPEGKDLFARVTKASQRLGTLIDDISRLTRARKLEKPAISLEGKMIVQEALARLEHKIQQTGARITVDQEFPSLYVDKTWAVEAIYNLIGNALKFRKDDAPPEIQIASYQPHDGDSPGIGFVVSDRGPGVPPEYAEKIFELFQRAVGREVEGTGAGLAIVFEVARRHGGKAWVRPREGGGSEFIITFDVSISAQEAVEDPDSVVNQKEEHNG